MKKLLIVDDNEGIRTQLKWGLSKEFKTYFAVDREEALKVVKKIKPDVMILDLGLPPCVDGVTEGLSCLKETLTILPKTKIIVITGNDDRETALKAIGLGAYDFYQKPIDLEVVKVILNRAFHLFSLEHEYRNLNERISSANEFENMVGFCAKMQTVFSSINKVAKTDATILITGESGTGKELVAQAIHRKSLRKNGEFVPINCGSIPENLIESELFGHEKGAFTDAKNQKIGLVEKASKGTLFLDEIGELPLQLQVKLLRFIQEKKIQRVGGTKEIEVDLRIVAATNVDFEKLVKDGKFREDLFFRISVINITLPPLRERGEDILILANKFLSRFSTENKSKVRGFSPTAIAALQLYSWAGNVRELENKIQRAVIMADRPILEPQDLSIYIDEFKLDDSMTNVFSLKEARTCAEINAIQKALMLQGGKIRKAAELLDITRPTLYDLMNKYGLKGS